MKVFRSHILVCGGTGCRASGSETVHQAVVKEIAAKGLSDEVAIVETGCNGFCAAGPIVVIYPEGTFYQYVKADDVKEIVEEHIVKGRPVKRLMYKEPVTEKPIPHMLEIPFFGKQMLIALKNRGLIDAEKIDEYIARDGYLGAAKALTEMTPDEVIEEVKKSGLRGRGGGGFPTGLKWSFARKSQGDTKYILCNADEGDPGAFMDRSILEADPHAVLEGMIIGGYSVGANKGYIYCRAEYPLAIKRLLLAIEQAKDYGLLGNDILGSGYSLDIEVYQGAGAFVCGEETALMGSIEGKRGMPRPRPPFPAVKGLWDKPSVLNNVETYANIPQIVLKGGSWYASIGTERSKGTKVFALTGAVNNVGLVEVPMGTPIGDIIFDIGGGIKGGKQYKAAQLGGPSGGCIPAAALNTPTDYEEIVKLGAIMGSGGLIVMDEDTCMVDTARFFMEFCQEESCGKCTPCREGTKRMLQVLQRICKGEGRDGDIELLEELATIIKDSALCGLGQTAPNPVLSTIRYFREEYESHIYDKKCPAAVCSALFKSPCQHACPIEMDVPAYIALIRAGRLEDAYRVMKRTNPFPGVCGRVCPQFCASKCRRGQLDDPMAIAWLKRYIADNGKKPVVEPVPVTRKEKIAIIGAGPAGLTAAQDLAKRGYKVTVFEELPYAGGMMRYAIPEYRLPRDVIEEEVKDIEALGVEIKTGCRVGKDISFDSLRKDYDIVVLAVGAHKSWKLGVEGEDLKGVWGATEFLREVNLGKDVKIGPRVAIVGGGNSAIDAARTAVRLGAKDVTILYRRERKDMPAWEHEIVAAEHEGVKIEYLVAPVKLIGKNGKLGGVVCQRMKLGEFDRSGRRKPVPIEGSEYTLSVDTIIPAISQSADTSFIPEGSDVKKDKWGGIEVLSRSKNRTTADGVFIIGDAATGPATVVEAIAMGHNVAADVDASIRLKNNEPAYKEPPEEKIEIPFEVDEEVVETPKAAMPELAVAKRISNFAEVELGYNKKTAFKEACRCLRCDAEI
ncbi:MAG: NADH-quinone oxidoreductase subunit NuoF [Desulfomonilia bacterium]|uniref:NADP-reducing hydrogenase subunit HndC n=1 Tax=anaerobic digester metagenome TaxID=1263854 RepID=A0A485LUV0_9ZZZZ|nr:NADH-quinone oxidoreductase subunit NuoF [Pseudomonadota bacterium]